jgi:Uma2 family endonuclease
MLLELRRLEVPPGQRLLLQDVTWQEFGTILEELGDRRSARLAHDKGTLEIMMPLPEHEDDQEIVGDLIKALLEELEIEFRSLGSTTFKKSQTQGLEPDQCFYIQNEGAIRGKKRIDLSVDPPPDLAIEIDVTSRTHPSIYEALGVPLGDVLPRYLAESKIVGRNKVLNASRQWVREQIESYKPEI